MRRFLSWVLLSAAVLLGMMPPPTVHAMESIPSSEGEAIVIDAIVTNTVSAVFLQTSSTQPLTNLTIEGPGGVFALSTTGSVASGDILIFTSSTLYFEDMPEYVHVFPGLPDFGAPHAEGAVHELIVSWTPTLFSVEEGEIQEFVTPLNPMEEPDAQQIQPRFSEEDELDPVEDRIEALVSYTDLQLAALLPNPEGSDLEGEEIHVRNRSNHSIDLSGVTLSDMTTTYRFPEGEQILPAQTLILPRSLTRISLNNSGSETIRLSDPNDVLLDEVTYTNSFEGEYYARTPAGWLWDHDSVDTPSDVVETEIPQYAQPTPKAFVLPTEKPAVTTTQEEQKVEPLADSSIAFATSGRLARLSEVFPAPLHTLEDEWVELLNPTEETIDISGYQLDDITDGGSKSYIFPEGSRIEAKTYFTIPKSESGIALNNTADTVHFLAPAGDVLDSFSYESTTKGMSFSRIDDDWQLTSPTPDEENTPSQDNAQTSSVTSATTSPHAQTDEQNSDADVSPTDSTRERTSIRTARSLPEGTPVRVSGIVTATAGELISNGFVVQDETSGIQVIFPRDSVPEISAGANVEVVGTIDTYRSATIVRAESPSRVTVLGEDAIPTPLDRELGELGLEDVGFRIITSGFLLSKQGQTMLLEDQGTELRVTFRERTGISKPSWETGSRITLSGILLQTSDGWRLYPSVPEDVEQQNDQPKALALGATDETTSTPPAQDTLSEAVFSTKTLLSQWNRLDVGIIVGTVLLLVAGVGWWLWKRYGIQIRTRISELRLKNA